MKPIAIKHIALSVSNFRRSEAFYNDQGLFMQLRRELEVSYFQN